MMEKSITAGKPATNTVSLTHHRRMVMLLVGLCCLSVGIAIGAVMRGAADARSEDNRLTISSSRPALDPLSASFARVAQDVEPSVAHIKVYESDVYQREGTGSGVVVNAAGYILTNQHVVKGATRIRVRLSDGSESDAKVIGVDPPTDLAVIKIETNKTLRVARMGDSDKLAVGDWVLAIGSPFGFEQTVTAGIISAKDRDDERSSTPFQRFLQTDAAINPGNSGGPLVNLSGEVIGINTQIATSTGAYNGIGFALPSSTAVDTYNQLIANGRVRRGYLGILPAEITPQIMRLNKLSDSQGVLIEHTLGETSPAARAGLRSGDVITSINNQGVKTPRELIRKIAAIPVGGVATIGYVRDGEPHTVSVTLEERQEESEMRLVPTDPRKLTPGDPRNPRGLPDKNDKPDRSKIRQSLGVNTRTLTAELAKQHGLEGAKGAFVVSVDPDSVADEKGVAQDDLIVEVNKRPINSAEDFERVARDLRGGDDVVIKLLRKSGAVRRAWFISLTMP